MNYTQALSFLSSSINLEKGLPQSNHRRFLRLDRMARLLACIGDPHRDVRFVHVAGTNGKGSTASFIASIARCHGYRVGLYTSPHLNDLCERIQIDGSVISRSTFSRGMEQLKRAVSLVRWPSGRAGRPTYFELLTALAFWHFRNQKVDLAVIEVGMGGRWDATNVVYPLVSVITQIGFDHEAWLGRRLEQIAGEKAGIVKPFVPVCMGRQRIEAERVIGRRSRETNSPLLKANNPRYVRMGMDGVRFQLRVSAVNLQIKTRLGGLFQAENASLAVMAYKAISDDYGFRWSNSLVCKGVLNTSWPGRFEWVRKKHPILLDGAHNEGAMKGLVDSLVRMFPRAYFRVVFGASRDKKIALILKELNRLKGKLYLTRSRHPRAAAPELLRKFLRYYRGPADFSESVERALRQARSELKGNNIVLVTGSLFLVGESRDILCRK